MLQIYFNCSVHIHIMLGFFLQMFKIEQKEITMESKSSAKNDLSLDNHFVTMERQDPGSCKEAEPFPL